MIEQLELFAPAPGYRQHGPSDGLNFFGGMWEPPDVDAAHESWGASCGPTALAAATGLTLAQIRPHLADFESRRHMNATHMLAACSSLRLPARLVRSWSWCSSPAALLRVQFGGPWLKIGVPPTVAFRYTHWIAARGHRVYDGNIGFWISRDDWWARVMPQIAGWMKRSDGTCNVRDAVI